MMPESQPHNTQSDESPDQTYSITKLAQEFDVTTRTIRFYEDEGLLTPGRRGTTRVYSKGDRTRLKLVLRGRRLGWSLGEIREVINMYDHPGGEQKQLQTMISKLRESRHTLLKQQEDIQHALDDLARLERNCDTQMQALETADECDLIKPNSHHEN